MGAPDKHPPIEGGLIESVAAGRQTDSHERGPLRRHHVAWTSAPRGHRRGGAPGDWRSPLPPDAWNGGLVSRGRDGLRPDSSGALDVLHGQFPRPAACPAAVRASRVACAASVGGVVPDLARRVARRGRLADHETPARVRRADGTSRRVAAAHIPCRQFRRGHRPLVGSGNQAARRPQPTNRHATARNAQRGAASDR